MEPVYIAPGVDWVGVLDPQLRIFDVVMHAEHGTTYNSYLIKGDDKTALIEANKGRFAGEFLQTLSRAVDPKDIDYIILNHMEPDHSGALGDLMEAAPNATLIFTRPGKSFAENMVNRTLDDHMVIAEGDSIDLGGKTLRFFIEPFLHWPDTMFTYLEEEKILFPCDFLGAHYCDDRLFDDKVGNYDYAFKYYFMSIMRPFKSYVLHALDRLADLDIRMVCPSHGPIIREKVTQRLESYREWATPPKSGDKKLLLVTYVSAYGHTAKLADAIAEGAAEAGAEPSLSDLEGIDMGVFLDEVERADGLLVGSCTINGDALPQAWELLSSLHTITVKGKVGGSFGSFGWSGEASLMLTDRMKGLKFKVPEKPFRSRLNPTEEDIEEAREFGKRIAEAL